MGIGLTAGVNGQQRMLIPPRHLIFLLHLLTTPVSLASFFDYDNVLHIVNYAIAYPPRHMIPPLVCPKFQINVAKMYGLENI
jgi:hypothetical protein